MKRMLVILILIFVPAFVTAQENKENPAPPTINVPRAVTVGSKRTTVPMEIIGGRPVVKVKINGQGPCKFIVDTGAGGTLIYKTLVDDL
ncbi:hypothetical protein BH10ACI2_BH10ACI2_04930 [soil metagenome]